MEIVGLLGLSGGQPSRKILRSRFTPTPSQSNAASTVIEGANWCPPLASAVCESYLPDKDFGAQRHSCLHVLHADVNVVFFRGTEYRKWGFRYSSIWNVVSNIPINNKARVLIGRWNVYIQQWVKTKFSMEENWVAYFSGRQWWGGLTWPFGAQGWIHFMNRKWK